jgi:hypothetical protein
MEYFYDLIVAMAGESLDKYYECHTNELIKIASACLSSENLKQLFLVKSCSSALRRASKHQINCVLAIYSV